MRPSLFVIAAAVAMSASALPVDLDTRREYVHEGPHHITFHDGPSRIKVSEHGRPDQGHGREKIEIVHHVPRDEKIKDKSKIKENFDVHGHEVEIKEKEKLKVKIHNRDFKLKDKTKTKEKVHEHGDDAKIKEKEKTNLKVDHKRHDHDHDFKLKEKTKTKENIHDHGVDAKIKEKSKVKVKVHDHKREVEERDLKLKEKEKDKLKVDVHGHGGDEKLKEKEKNKEHDYKRHEHDVKIKDKSKLEDEVHGHGFDGDVKKEDELKVKIHDHDKRHRDEEIKEKEKEKFKIHHVDHSEHVPRYHDDVEFEQKINVEAKIHVPGYTEKDKFEQKVDMEVHHKREFTQGEASALNSLKLWYYTYEMGLTQDANANQKIKQLAALLTKYQSAQNGGLVQATDDQTSETSILLSTLTNPATRGQNIKTLTEFSNKYAANPNIATKQVAAAKLTSLHFILEQIESRYDQGDLAVSRERMQEIEELHQTVEEQLAQVSERPDQPAEAEAVQNNDPVAAKSAPIYLPPTRHGQCVIC